MSTDLDIYAEGRTPVEYIVNKDEGIFMQLDEGRTPVEYIVDKYEGIFMQLDEGRTPRGVHCRQG